MARRPTILDVARAAGVSKSTVSLVLQASPRVREKTHRAVREAMARLGYVYNRAAANLRSANGGLIGLVINDLRNPFFTEFATSLQMALSARGYATVVANTDEDATLQAQVVSAMIEHGVSAMVLSPAYGEAAIPAFDAIARAEIRAMQVLRRVEPRTNLFPFAAPDYPAGSRMATDHLLARGARRIAFVGGLDGRPVTRERLSGYLDGMAAAGRMPLVLTGRASRAFGRDAAIRLARDHSDADAALCFNDLVALGLLSGCAEIGRTVGAGFRVVGFDDIEESADCHPRLTTVGCDIAAFAERIAATLLAWMEEGVKPLAEMRTPVRLVIRDST